MISINPRTIFAVFALGAFANSGRNSSNNARNAGASSLDAYATPSASMADSFDLIASAALDVALDVTASSPALVVDAPNTSARRRAISSSLAGARGFMVARSTRATTCADERDR